MTYAEQLLELAHLLATPDGEDHLRGFLAADSRAAQVKLFVDGNLEKRRDKLRRELDFVAEAYPDFDSRIIEYIESTFLLPYDTGTSDGDRMLNWLKERRPSAAQHDYIACQQARNQIEQFARGDRLGYVRFQERYSLVDQLSSELEINEALTLYLNPIRCWARFTSSELLDGAANPPANVLFFAVAGEIGTVVLELEGQALLNEIDEFGPCTVREWAALSQSANLDELTDFSRELMQMGLLALG